MQWLVRKRERNLEQLPTSKELLVKRAFDGIEAVTRVLYPLLFLGIWGFDNYNYWLNPQNRYQMSLRDLLLGLPQNYHYENASLASNLGGDIASIHRWNYWPWTGVVTSALLSGVLFTATSRPRQTPIFYQMDSKELRSFFTRFKEDFIQSFPYLTTYYWQLYRWKNYLIQKNYQERKEDIKYADVVVINNEIKNDYQELLKRFVSEGYLLEPNGVTTRLALPLDGNQGGIYEVIVPNPKTQIELERVSGVNPQY